MHELTSFWLCFQRDLSDWNFCVWFLCIQPSMFGCCFHWKIAISRSRKSRRGQNNTKSTRRRETSCRQMSFKHSEARFAFKHSETRFAFKHSEARFAFKHSEARFAFKHSEARFASKHSEARFAYMSYHHGTLLSFASRDKSLGWHLCFDAKKKMKLKTATRVLPMTWWQEHRAMTRLKQQQAEGAAGDV